mgnify:FL=1
MIEVRKSEERGHADHGWLNSYHTFSFADYYDPKYMGFRSLRVINEDRVAPGRGFGAHGHRDMEILSYVVDGSLAHKDNMGHQKELGPNEIQRMSAGTGVIHSEFNPSGSKPVHFFQIWIEPASTGGKPSYQQIAFDPKEKQGKFRLLASPQQEDGAAKINQDAKVFAAELADSEKLSYPLGNGRYGWLHVVRGRVNVNGTVLETGDAGAVTKEDHLTLVGDSPNPSEVLLFDLA